MAIMSGAGILGFQISFVKFFQIIFVNFKVILIKANGSNRSSQTTMESKQGDNFIGPISRKHSIH